MNKKILFLILLAVIMVVPLVSLAQSGSNNDPCTVITAFQKIFEEAGAAIVIIGWIITGILYLTAAGDPTKLKTGKTALVACVIGTAAVILSVTAFGFINGALNIGGTQGDKCGGTGTESNP